jgi:hydroxyacylglutathione hydrolase
MKRVNKEGPRILGAGHRHEMLDVAGLVNAVQSGTVIDLTPSSEFAKRHVPGTINIPMSMLSTWAGWLVDYDQPTYLICQPDQLEEAARVMHKIGVEEIVGAFDSNEVRSCKLATESYASTTSEDAFNGIESGELKLLDVRSN